MAPNTAYETTRLADPRAFELIVTVNRALAQIQSSDAIVEIFPGAFDPDAEPTPALIVLYGLGNVPE